MLGSLHRPQSTLPPPNPQLTKGPKVRWPAVVPFAPQYLRGGVLHGPAGRPEEVLRPGDAPQPKVCQLGVPALRQQHVLGLDVAVEDARRVAGTQSAEQLAEETPRLRLLRLWSRGTR